MNSKQYCRQVEREELRRDEIAATISIQEDGSPLVSLKDAGLPLLFEPSMVKGYDYRVREAVFPKVERVSQRLEAQNKTLIIRSVWRSFDHQHRLWEKKAAVMRDDFPDRAEHEIEEMVSRFVARPRESMHATGGAVDALIHDMETGRVLDFGNNVGLKLELDETCYPQHPGISTEARQNRELLMNLFLEEGFVVDCLEYWHFDYGNVRWAAGSGVDVARYGVIEEVTA